jgi:hypothetical protein
VSRLESSIESSFVEAATEAGWITIKADRIVRGWSDRLFFGYGPRTVVIEFKREGARGGRRGEKYQDYIRSKFLERGYECYKVVTEDEATTLCARLCKENTRAGRRRKKR